MALARQDRTPIEEILARTPELPEGCQWATFLRNHDELTLEMVTSEERDFMWDYYAPEPRMRLNLGIRRRLAPLLDNDRERIEMANSILLTFIGSPVIYYGDEIGMGDNIWLEDRDGVRTPMQWDDSQNAGFSDAKPEALYDPVIEEEPYAYEEINVAEQRDDPDSLLNALRRLIEVRKQYDVFGRGEMQLLDVEPKAVLAYLRIKGPETMLVLNNLSPDIQEVTLELPEYRGSVPLDVLTGEELPEIGSGPYRLELQGNGYRWLRLQRA
jgi:maltose alpha-D-glucosyltransferase/alpha-amylase